MFTDTYLPTRDGVVTSILNTKRELEAQGHEVFIFAPEPYDRVSRDPDVFYFKAKAFRSYDGYTVAMFPTEKCSILRGLGVDVIHTHGLFFQGLRSMLAGKELRLPVVLTWHTMVTDAVKYYNFTMLPEWFVDKMMWIYLRTLLTRAECVVAPTHAIEAELRGYAPRMRRIEVVPTGIDTERFNCHQDGRSMRERMGVKDNEKMVLALGRVAWEKNLDLVLKGFACLHKDEPHTKLVVAGNGPAMGHCVQLAKELGISDHTRFPGFVDDKDLPKLYAACDAFTIASKFETQGLVLLEAMATAKPISGIDYRAVGELIVDGKNGFKFKDDPEDWARATKAALYASDEVRRNARRTAEQFSIKKGVESLVKIYESSIVSKRTRVSR
ncbi:MAG: glycosyltransferase [Methanomassiliicoccales archaeon]|nr:MAG: glycosyltransferase [Methanomassiliicoccales archaeon]